VSATSLQLIALDCHRCGSSLGGEPTDMIFVCDHCGAAAVLGDRLEPVEAVGLMPAPGRQARILKPAWLVEARVVVEDRLTAEGRRTPGSDTVRSLVIPAFDLALPDLWKLALALTGAAGVRGETPREPVRGGVMHLDDALTFARYLVIGEEIHRPDLLRSARVTIEPRQSLVAAVPFEEVGSDLRCCVTGVRVRASA